DGTYGLPRVHHVKAFVDLFQRKGVRNEVIDVDLAFHVPVHNGGYIGTAPGAPKGRAFPFAPRDELEGAGGYLGTGGCHANDDGLAPAAMAAFQCLSHDIGVADALERIVDAAISQLNDIVNHVFGLFGVDEVCHAELPGHGFSV